MSFLSIPTSWTNVGKAFKKEFMDRIKLNFDAHEERLNALSLGSGPVEVINDDFYNISSSLALNGVFYKKMAANAQITKAQIQIFGKDGIGTGTLEYDIKKSSSINGTYVSIFTTKPYISYSSDAAGTSRDGVFNAGQSVLRDDYLRIDFTNVPAGVISKVHVMINGVLS